MTSANIQSMIPKMQQYFIGQPIKKAWLFGSSSRGEEQSDSDIDILVQYDDNAGISLFTISRIMVQMKKLLGRNVDIVEDGRLLPFAAPPPTATKSLYMRERVKDRGRLEHMLAAINVLLANKDKYTLDEVKNDPVEFGFVKHMKIIDEYLRLAK